MNTENENYLDVSWAERVNRITVNFIDLIYPPVEYSNVGKEYLLKPRNLTIYDINTTGIGSTDGVPAKNGGYYPKPIAIFENGFDNFDCNTCERCGYRQAKLTTCHTIKEKLCFNCMIPVTLDVETMTLNCLEKNNSEDIIVNSEAIVMRMLLSLALSRGYLVSVCLSHPECEVTLEYVVCSLE